MDGSDLREGIYLVVRDPENWCQYGVLFGDSTKGWYLLTTSDSGGLKFERFTATALCRDFVQVSGEQAAVIRENLITARSCPGVANCPVVECAFAFRPAWAPV